MMAPGVIFFVIWHYVPIWNAKMAFEQVRIIPPNIWVGLKNFQLLFASPVFYQVMWNTVIISAMKIVFVFPVPILVALMLNEVRSGPLRKAIQSAVYLPHFLSWGGDLGHLHRALGAERRGQRHRPLGRAAAGQLHDQYRRHPLGAGVLRNVALGRLGQSALSRRHHRDRPVAL